jgi:hypothetical protein
MVAFGVELILGFQEDPVLPPVAMEDLAVVLIP